MKNRTMIFFTLTFINVLCLFAYIFIQIMAEEEEPYTQKDAHAEYQQNRPSFAESDFIVEDLVTPPEFDVIVDGDMKLKEVDYDPTPETISVMVGGKLVTITQGKDSTTIITIPK